MMSHVKIVKCGSREAYIGTATSIYCVDGLKNYVIICVIMVKIG